MLSYFKYLGKSIWIKPGVWIGLAIFWIYTAVLLLIVPGVTHMCPITLWGNGYISLQGLYYVIISVVSGLFVVYIFRSGIENETELIIMSKPIKRWKISVVKFVWIILGACVAAVGATILSIFTLCFGHYNNLTNPGGMKFNKLLPLIGSIWLGTIVISLIFDGIGILISSFANFIQIIVTLVASSIVVFTYGLVVTTVLNRLCDNIESQVGDALESRTFITGDGQKKQYAYLDNMPADDLYKVYDDVGTTSNRVAQYLNIGHQFSNLFNSFEVNDLTESLNGTAFGGNINYDTTIDSTNDNLLNNLVENYNDAQTSGFDNCGHLYLTMPYYRAVFYDTSDKTNNYEDSALAKNLESGIYSIGMDPNELLIISFVDANSSTVYVSNKQQSLGNVVPAIWLNGESLQVDDNDQVDNFNEAVFKDLFIPLLQGKNQEDNYWYITYDDSDQEKLDVWLDAIWSFLNSQEIKSQYNIPLSTEKNVNNAVAYVEYSLIKCFVWTYWTQIVPNYLSTQSITINQFLANGETDDSIYPDPANPIPYYLNILTTNINYQLKDPIGNTYDFSSTPLSVSHFIRYFYSYCDTNWFSHSTLISSFISLGEVYNDTCAYIKFADDAHDSIIYDWDNYLQGDKYFNAFIGKQTLTNVSSSCLGISHIYHYTTKPFVDNTTASAIWLTISLVLWIISMGVYSRLDIK